jgi:2-polyprenyl-3-methyl-5-hydroxy-6-metoxy-1,4-benzoquinol methylase
MDRLMKFGQLEGCTDMALGSRVWHRSGKLTFIPEVDAASHSKFPDRYRWASQWVGSLQGLRVADVGCWTGSFLEHLASADRSVELVGIDLSGPWLEEAMALHPDMEFVPVESLVLPLKGQLIRFDTVFFLETLEHLPLGSESQVLKNLAGLLAPGGELILSTPVMGFAAITDPAWLLVGHRHYTYGRLTKLCAQAGLEINEVAYSGNLWSIIDSHLMYIFKHVLHRTRHGSGRLQERADTGLYNHRRFTTNNVWIRAFPVG